MPDELICMAKLRTDLHKAVCPCLGLAQHAGHSMAAHEYNTQLELMKKTSGAAPKVREIHPHELNLRLWDVMLELLHSPMRPETSRLGS